ncbi:MAG: hypothetical protein KKB25_03245 [Nanoarchaeota archaeon]|nr:hypothetical protein [Nanoarchaeota archaeon]
MISDTFETRSMLEKAAIEIRDYVDSFDYRKFKPPSKDALFGKCGFAAKIASQKLQSSLEPEEIKIYSISDGYHFLAVLGDDFESGWKIDPTIAQFESIKDKNKLVFGPYERYPLIFAKHPSGKIVRGNPKLLYHNYFQ